MTELQLFHPFYSRKYSVIRKQLPSGRNQDDFVCINETTIIVRSNESLIVDVNRFNSYISILNGVVVMIWIIINIILLFYFALFISTIRINLIFFNIDPIILIFILLMSREIVSPKKSLTIFLFKGLKRMKESYSMKLDLKEKHIHLSPNLNTWVNKKKLIHLNLDYIDEFKIIELNSTYTYALYLNLNHKLSQNDSPFKEKKRNNSSLLVMILTDQSFANQLQQFLNETLNNRFR